MGGMNHQNMAGLITIAFLTKNWLLNRTLLYELITYIKILRNMAMGHAYQVQTKSRGALPKLCDLGCWATQVADAVLSVTQRRPKERFRPGLWSTESKKKALKLWIEDGNL